MDKDFKFYDERFIHINVNFYPHGYPNRHWKFSVAWYEKGNWSTSNFGDAESREDAEKKALELAEKILNDRTERAATKKKVATGSSASSRRPITDPD